MTRTPQPCQLGLIARLALALWLAMACAVDSAPLLPIREVLASPADGAAQGRPLRVRGVLTYYEPGHRMAFVQDDTGAIYVHVTTVQPLVPGDRVEVTGYIDPGFGGRHLRGRDFDTNPEIRRLGPGQFPSPRPVADLAGLASGPGALWMVFEGLVAAVSLDADRARLTLAEAPGLPVFISGISRAEALPGHLRGLRVRIHGIIADSALSEAPLVMHRMIVVPGLEQVEIPPGELARQFSGAEVGLSELPWPHARAPAGSRRVVRGSVTWVKPGEGFFLQQGTSVAWVQAAMAGLPAPGDTVEAAGEPAAFHGAGYLRDALWRAAEARPEPPPAPVDFPGSGNPDLHGRLVRVTGRVVEVRAGMQGELVLLRAGKGLVFARGAGASGNLPAAGGSLVAVTGVMLDRPSPAAGEAVTGEATQVLWRHPRDLEVLAPPPFWTPVRLVATLCGVFATTLAAFAWVAALRRTVRRQAHIIRREVASSAIGEERLRIAREWHDSVEQHFAGLTMLLDAAAVVAPPDQPAGRMLRQAARLADHSRAETRAAIWDLRTPSHHEPCPFASELQAEFTAEPGDLGGPSLTLECGDQTTCLPPAVARRVLRVATEAVTNARKHAACTHITLRWAAVGHGWVLEVEDNGSGLPPGCAAGRSPGGHFGLLGMRERAARLNATLTILSPPVPGTTGTLVRLFIPATATRP